MNIFLRELRANVKSLLIWSAVIILLIVIAPAKFSAFAGDPSMLAVLDAFGAERAFIIGQDFGAQFAGELALLLDGVENAVAALGQGGEVLGAFVHRFELGFVEIAGDVLAVTGHEGDGGSRVEQLDGALHLFVLQRDFLRNAAYEF